MGYDARRYRQMLREGVIHRIVNIVLHFDRDGEKPPSDLEQIMQKHKDDGLARFFFNYGFISLNVYELAEKYNIFRCEELRRVLYYFKLEKEGGLLMENLSQGSLSRDAALLCAIFLGLDIQIDDDIEEVDMCKAVKDFKRKWFKVGAAWGEARGENNHLKKMIANLLELKYDFQHIAQITKESLETVQLIAQSFQSDLEAVKQ